MPYRPTEAYKPLLYLLFFESLILLPFDLCMLVYVGSSVVGNCVVWTTSPKSAPRGAFPCTRTGVSQGLRILVNKGGLVFINNLVYLKVKHNVLLVMEPPFFEFYALLIHNTLKVNSPF